MSETVWVSLLTGAFTLASGVIGVVLTHRYSRGQADAARREDRRRDARSLIAAFVEAGTQWAEMNSAVIPAYYKAAGGDQSFWMEWPNTDSGKAIREHALTITRTAGELRLIVGDEILLERIDNAQAAMSDSNAMTALLDEGKRTRGGHVGGRRHGRRLHLPPQRRSSVPQRRDAGRRSTPRTFVGPSQLTSP